MANNFILQIAKRAGEMHSVKMCRLCLQQKDLVHIAANHRLVWCFSRILPSDDEFPQFVCAVCQQLIDILYQFNVLGNLTANLIRSYVKDGTKYPRTEMIEEELRRAEKRLQQSGKEPVGKASKTIEKDTVDKYSEKHPQQIEKHKSDEALEKPKPKPARKQSKEYMKSDKFLFGDIVELKQLSKKDETATDKACAKPRKLITSLENQDNKENTPPTSNNVKIKDPSSSSSQLSKSTQRFRSLSHRENIHRKATGLQLKVKIRHNSSKVSEKRVI